MIEIIPRAGQPETLPLRAKIDLECNDIKYTLWRLDDTEYRKLWNSSVPIANEYDFYVQLYLSQHSGDTDNLNLAELFTILEYLLGESSDLYDNYKGSFEFPNLLAIERKDGVFFYLMSIYDHRGSIQFNLYKIIENTDGNSYESKIVHQPFITEFSRKEINYFFNYFYGYLVGAFTVVKLAIPQKNFLKKIDSNLILYGYKDGEYFEQDYDSKKAYEAQIESFEQTYGTSINQIDISALLQKITKCHK